MTRAVGKYSDDVWVRVCYLITFLLMYLFVIIIFLLVRHNEDKQELEEIKKRRSDSFRLSIISTLIMMGAVSFAVVGLIFSLLVSYIALAVGIGIIVALRISNK